MTCAYDDCTKNGTTEVAGAEVGLPTNTDWGGTVVCDSHAQGLRQDLAEMMMDGDRVENYIAPAIEGYR